jgi:hypothetical protein
MKIVIKENKRNKVVTKWLDDNYGNMNVVYENNPRYITFKDVNDEDVFLYNVNTDKLSIMSPEIQKSLKTMFGLNRDVMNSIVKPWMESIYGFPIRVVVYQTWHCNTCGNFHDEPFHIEDDSPSFY